MNFVNQFATTADMNFLTKKRAIEMLRRYGFIEISDALRFLNFVSGEELNANELSYLRREIELCLRHHDNGSDYFIDLREFATELDFLIAI